MLLTLAAVLATAAPALPQNANAGGNAAARNPEGEYSSWDFGAYFGTQWFQMWQGDSGRTHELLTRPLIGIRSTQNVGRYLGLEESFGLGFNRLALLPSGGNFFVTDGARNYQLSILGLGYLTPRTARYRPYVEVGPTGVIYQPYRPNGTNIKQPPPGFVPATIPAFLRTKTEPGFVYGVGMKLMLTRRWDTNINLRGMWTPDPNFGLPDQPGPTGTLYVTQHHGLNGLQFTVGVGYRMGIHEPPPPPAPAPPPPPPPPPPPTPALTVSNIQGAPANACPGDNVRLNVTASGGPPDATKTYQWTVNGAPAPGGTGDTFNLSTANATGPQAVRVTVTAGGMTANSNTVNIAMRTAGPPRVTFNVNPSTINYGDRVPLNAQATGSDCGGAVTTRYTASEGTIAGNQFDSSGVRFDMANRLKQQTKTVQLTATATDAKGATASANANVTVNLKPEASRQDVVFSNRSARVNNAAKRYLIEQLTARLKDDPGSSIILIGHRDMSETGRAAANLDRDRVNNVAAVLSAGTGVCPSLDLSRVQVAWVGTDQATPPMPFADASVKERSGQAATDARAQFRRVEVWFIPSGADRPSIPGLMPVDAARVKRLGCPR